MLYYNYYRFSSYIVPFIKYNNPYKIWKNSIYTKKFLKLQPIEIINTSNNQNINVDKKDLIDIYIIAFNKPFLIEAQIHYLKKNLKDDYRLNIMDNSTIKSESDKIKKICINNMCNYVKLPKNNLQQSHSH